MLIASWEELRQAAAVLVFALALSIAGLSLGPVLGRWAQGRAHALAALDAATLALVPGVILLRLLPHLVEDTGISAAIGLAIGYVALQIAEAASHRSASTLGIVVVLPALAIHAFFDGAALGVALGNDVLETGGVMLAAALLVHRIPEGLFLASTMAAAGVRRTSWGILAISIATIVGGLAGRELLHHQSGDVLHIAVAVGLGVMLRLVLHRHDVDRSPTPRALRIGGITFVVCLALVVITPSPQHVWSSAQPHELSVIEALVPLFLESSLLLLGLLVVGELLARVVRRNDEPADPWSATFVLGAWLLGPALAFTALVGPFAQWSRRYREQLRLHWTHLLPRARQVLPGFGVGVIVAVAAEAALPTASLDGLDAVVIPAAALFGFFTGLGAGAALIAAVLAHKGAPDAAVIAYLLSSAAHAALRHGTIGSRLMAVVVAAAAGVLLGPLFGGTSLPSLHELGHHIHPVVEWIGAAILAAWIVVDLARTGPRRWM